MPEKSRPRERAQEKKGSLLTLGSPRVADAHAIHSLVAACRPLDLNSTYAYLLLCEQISGEEAERIGLISLTCEESELNGKSLEVARKLAAGAQTALRWTKSSLNNCLRMAGPAFDASLAYEMLGFTGPEAKEGIASHREKRAPKFPPEPKDF